MSAVRRVSTEQPVPAAAGPVFDFPEKAHLLVTCPNRIFSWDSAGIKTIFESSKCGIAAAREAKDGSGVLAIADKQVVVLHDTRRGQQRSWGLEAAQDEVRHLEYTADSKSLFLSTNLTVDIQRYSTERSRLLDPTNIHASPPIAMAVSPTGHVMVSASDDPPTVYLKNLAHNSSPILIEPRASRAAVSVIAFHPERANIFLMAFRDGSMAAYDATRLNRQHGGQYADQQGVNHGQISAFLKLHRGTTENSRMAAITDAAFLPGFKTSAVTVGSDGRCRIIDFAGKGEVIRTWHAKAPITSVSVLSLKGEQFLRSPFARSRTPHTIGGPTSTDSLLAISRADGAVRMYSLVGLLLEHKTLGDDVDRAISVEWVNGPSPRPISETVVTSSASQVPSVPAKSTRRKTVMKGSPRGLELKSGPARQFTVHPDEAEESTVRHTPMAGNAQSPTVENGAYLDLFSPVKPAQAMNAETNRSRVASPARQRPRISSQTFVRSPGPAPAIDKEGVAKPRNLALFPSTDSADDVVSPAGLDQRVAKLNQSGRSAQKQPMAWTPSDGRRSRKSASFKAAATQSKDNARILADLRKMNATQGARQTGGILAAFSTTQPGRDDGVKSKRSVKSLVQRPTQHIETEADSLEALEKYEAAHRERKWVEDSEQETSLGGDIWLTPDSDDQNARASRRTTSRAVGRSPARQTSRSRVTSKGTMSNTAERPTAGPSATLQGVDGSTGEEDEGIQTAPSHVSRSANFSPSSNDVRHLFPRTSSLSPRKHGSSAKRSQRLKRPTEGVRRTLREVTLNTVHVRQAKSPWEKVRASKAAVTPPSQLQRPPWPVDVYEDPACTNGTDGTSADEQDGVEPHCSICRPTHNRVVGLEDEVALLKGEVLALKAALRRSGMPVPKAR